MFSSIRVKNKFLSFYALGFLMLGILLISLIPESNFQFVLAIASLGLAVVVGLGKFATPWGYNAAVSADLSSGRRLYLKRTGYIISYILPAAIVWGFVGQFFLWLNNLLPLIILIATVYTLYYGIVEVWELRFQPPGLHWQVPAEWINEGAFLKRSLIWGSLLGPGFVTLNPYAGMWALIWLVASSQNIIVALLVGVMHSTARVIGILYNVEIFKSGYIPIAPFLLQGKWKLVDGLVLLFISGILLSRFF